MGVLFLSFGPECPGPIYLAGQWLIQHCYWYYYYRVLFERFCQAVSPFPMGSSLIICIRVRRLSGDPFVCVVQMWGLPSLGQQRLGLFCLVALVRLAVETAK